MSAMSPISEQLLAQCHPQLSTLIHQMFDMLLAETPSIVIHVDQGLRTFAQQDVLYAQGRTAPGKIVTNARGGFSNHNFGMAVDLVPGIVGQPWTPDWNGNDATYAAMVKAGEKVGLVCGANWKSMVDKPHFQLALMPATPTAQMREDLANGGVELVWNNALHGDYVNAEA